MSLQSGSKIGPYEIVGPIGAGGMGEVYRASDPRIGRDVAIKILPAAYAEDSERLRRFEVEARAAGSLNHPNILSIFDVGTHDLTPYLVTELLEGATLREKIRSGALSQRRVVEYGLQIARGLAAAHDKGILHRDLKPENVFVTNDGHVKILDFGLAKLTRPEGVAKSNVPTATFQTETGAVMGTAGYMSPEQVRGETVDLRSDLFALGAILYEMLSGKRAFTGNSAVETMNAILNADPPELGSQTGGISPAFERVINHCLEKSASHRFQSARDLAFAIEAVTGVSGASSTQSLASVGKGSWLRRNLAWAVAAVACFVALASIVITARNASPKVVGQVIHTSILPPSDDAFDALFWGIPLSPDGKYLSFFAHDSDGKGKLWVRALDSTQAHVIVETHGGNPHPFWSPDSKSIGYYDNGKLYRIDVSGGSIFAICDIPDFRGGSWSRDGIIVLAPNALGSPLYQVPAGGGKPVPATQLSTEERGHRFPWFLPDGRHFLYVTNPQKNVYAGSLDSKERTLILQNASYTQYAPPGYIVYVKDGNLVAQSFDAEKLKVSGEPVPITPDHVQTLSMAATAAFSVSQTGMVAYQKFSQTPARLRWFDRTGKEIGTIGDEDYYDAPRISPDTKKVAVFIRQANQEVGDLWLLDPTRNQKTRLTFHPADYWQPVWSPDGTQIAYASDWNDGVKIYKINLNGDGSEQVLYQSPNAAYADNWAPDGKSLSIQVQAPDTQSDIWILPLTGERKPVSFVKTPFFEGGGRFSPDGRLLAYSSNESGQGEIYVRSISGEGEKYKVSTGSGFNPHWRKDGKELFYYDIRSNALMSVEILSLNPFSAGEPKQLLPFPSAILEHDISSDGQRILIDVAAKEVLPEPITLVQNWTAVLKK